ncbi:GNAT family N-acetyltransferase [Streptomyces sp. ITFR-16]|uniref:GNAT family N-acetyltransferase n=1 Tax=Streptomyces sp. ITFR-16 TaxID=3075198 RepID=UPI00288A07C8|nr:GNAT family N-acetyltransferase [Streptomyces sp. ITFR-16]WNI20589.1 GNAT family N-acetyltransferase [Streptomyces sp. ITFR-16]
MLTLREVADNPSALTDRVVLADGPEVTFRPLVPGDAEPLAAFLAALSPESRRFSTHGGHDLAAAVELCDAIARYDKLRLVLEEVPSGRITGLLELSLDLHPSDIDRYRRSGIPLTATDCRFGATLADDHQGKGVGTQVFPLVADVARRFGRRRIILWGGVLTDNPRAIRYYEKNGFRPVGAFTGADGTRSLDMILDLDRGF